MRKVRSLDLDPLSLDPFAVPRRRWRTMVLTLMLTLVLAPVAYESAGRCAANWRSMFGPTVHVETPVLDAIQTTFTWSITALRYQVSHCLNSTPWEPSVVIACGIALAVLVIAPLRSVF